MSDTIITQIHKYCALLQLWNQSYEEYAKSAGLSYTSLSVLSAISSADGCTQKYLCERCFLPKQTVNAVVTSFLKKGWISMHEDPGDRRSKVIRLTESGAEQSGIILSKVRDSEKTAMLALSEEERVSLLQSTERYVTECRNNLIK